MISIDKLVQQLQQCKDTSITLPSSNESKFVQNTAFDIRKCELELLNNNFELLTEANYTMDKELENNKLQTGIIKNNKEFSQEVIPSKSLIIYTENETANVPEILTNLLPQTVFNNNEWYIYGIKNPESFYKSFLLLSKVDFIIKNKNEKKNEIATFKREMAIQYETFYKKLNYRKLKFPRNDMVNKLTEQDNYTEYDALQFVSDYSKLNFIILDIINQKYIDIKYIDAKQNNAKQNDNQFAIIIKYASNTYLPLMNSNGKHTFNSSIIDIISKNFERILITKYKEPSMVSENGGDGEDGAEDGGDGGDGESRENEKLIYNIEDILSNSIDINIDINNDNDNDNNDINNEEIKFTGYDIQSIINSGNTGNTGNTGNISNTINIIDIEEQETEPIGKSNTSINNIDNMLSRIPMFTGKKKTKKELADEAKLAAKSAANAKPDVTAKPEENTKDELKPLAKYNLVELQIMAKIHKIDTQKMGNCNKKVNKLKGELYDELKAKMH